MQDYLIRFWRSLNRTNVELKPEGLQYVCPELLSLNRTNVELKRKEITVLNRLYKVLIELM